MPTHEAIPERPYGPVDEPPRPHPARSSPRILQFIPKVLRTLSDRPRVEWKEGHTSAVRGPGTTRLDSGEASAKSL